MKIFPDKNLIYYINAFFSDIHPLIQKYGRKNITFIGDFNADLTHKNPCPRSTLFSKLLNKYNLIPCLPLTSTCNNIRKSDINHSMIYFVLNYGIT